MLKCNRRLHTVDSNVKNRCSLTVISWKLWFKSATGKIKESLKIIMLTCSFNDVAIQPSTQGNWFKVKTKVKHTWFESVISKIKGRLKEKLITTSHYHVNLYFSSCWHATIRTGQLTNSWGLFKLNVFYLFN